MIDLINLRSAEMTLKVHAKALGIPSGAANDFIRRSLKAAEKSLSKRKMITEADFVKAVGKELKKYSPDLAYVYENYDKII